MARTRRILTVEFRGELDFGTKITTTRQQARQYPEQSPPPIAVKASFGIAGLIKKHSRPLFNFLSSKRHEKKREPLAYSIILLSKLIREILRHPTES